MDFREEIKIAKGVRHLERSFEESSLPGLGLGKSIDEATENAIYRGDATVGGLFR